jgi:hypothetical protein
LDPEYAGYRGAICPLLSAVASSEQSLDFSDRG